MQREYQKEYQREYQELYRLNYDWIRYLKMDAQLGTTSFSEYMERDKNGKPDFNKELKAIKKEKSKTIYGRYKQYGSRKKHLRHTLYNYR